MYKPKRLAGAVCALALTSTSLALGACSDVSSGDDGSDGTTGTIHLTQWYHEYGQTGTRDAVERYAAEYSQDHPDVTVEVVWIPTDYDTKLNAALLAGQGPDIFESTPLGERIWAGQVAPLDDIFGAELSDFNPNNIAAMSVDGQVYGIATQDGTGLLFYRKSLLAQAGIAPPQTMDQLIAAAEQLTTSTQKGLFIGNDGCSSGNLPWISIWASGTEIISQDGRLVLDVDRTAQAFSKLKELCSSNSLLLGAPQDWWDSSAFIDGLAAMQWGGQWTLPQVQEALGDDFGAVPWPALDSDGQPATWYGGWYEQVNAASPNVQAAKDFVRWLWIENVAAQTEWQTAFSSTTPVRFSIIDSVDELKSGVARDFVDAQVDYGHLYGGPYWTSAIELSITTALNNIIRDNADPVAEVTRCAATIQSELDRIAAESKIG
ncbi:MAG: sugar ABC transporter substrate-binding protein [Propionibacteriaceae bacterium]|jgi:multiple sugar transport system substrate-binding protein|nr:sugar ABC transporter substrate-binding protein [Propionibacteriaceae bacterium]